MTKELTKVVYKPDTQSTDEYIMIVNQPEVKVILSLFQPMLINLFIYTQFDKWSDGG